MRRLLLVRHGSTAAVRTAAFGADESLDAAGVDGAARLHARLPRGEVLVSPMRRAVQTAAGLGACRVVSELAECDFGTWAGLTLSDIDPEDLGAWMTDPDAVPHGGESLTAVLRRVANWLDEQASLDGTAIAITHGGVVKAAVVHALSAPPSAFWRIDVSPLSITELHAHDGRWTVTRVNDRENLKGPGPFRFVAADAHEGDEIVHGVNDSMASARARSAGPSAASGAGGAGDVALAPEVAG